MNSFKDNFQIKCNNFKSYFCDEYLQIKVDDIS